MGAFSYQNNDYACGLHAFTNAVSVFGIALSYGEAKMLVGTTSRRGTSKRGLISGIRTLGLCASPYLQKDRDVSWSWLLRYSDKQPIIVLLDRGSHWATVTGRTGNQVILVDPSPNFKRGENGVGTLSKDEMLGRWCCRGCYAIRVHRP